MTLGLRQKQDLSPRRPSFWAKNRFEACGDPRFGLKIDLKPAARVISRQKQDLGPRRPSFCGVCVGAYCIRPTNVPTGTGARHIHSAPLGAA